MSDEEFEEDDAEVVDDLDEEDLEDDDALEDDLDTDVEDDADLPAVVDLAAILNTSASAVDVNAALKAAADGPMKGILAYSTDELVSIDFKDDPRSAIIDAPSTILVDKTQVKILAWYDNEWGYANRLVDLVELIGAHDDGELAEHAR